MFLFEVKTSISAPGENVLQEENHRIPREHFFLTVTAMSRYKLNHTIQI